MAKMNLGGGQYYTRRVAVGDTPTQLNTPSRGRNGIGVQQDGDVDVRIGGPDVSFDDDAHKGWLLAGTPATTPPALADSWSELVTSADLYAVAPAGQTAHVIVLEVR